MALYPLIRSKIAAYEKPSTTTTTPKSYGDPIATASTDNKAAVSATDDEMDYNEVGDG